MDFSISMFLDPCSNFDKYRTGHSKIQCTVEIVAQVQEARVQEAEAQEAEAQEADEAKGRNQEGHDCGQRSELQG